MKGSQQMRKFILRYLFFWAPAFILSFFFRGGLMQLYTLKWFFAFFMLFGWGVNTAMAAYHYPRRTMSGILMYVGFNILAIVGLYSWDGVNRAVYYLGGIFSFTPLDILVVALLDFNIPHELYVALLVFCICSLGWIAGMLYRRVNPDPYRPKMGK